jgi:hypothetical protein
LSDLLTSFLAGLAVLTVELTIGKLILGKGGPAPIQQSATTTGPNSPINQTITQHGSQIHIDIKRTVVNRSSPGGAVSTPSRATDDDGRGQIIAVGVAMLIALVVVTTALGKYSAVVADVLWGAAAGTACAALVVAVRAPSGTAVPVRRWAAGIIVTTGFVAAGAWLLPTGAFHGVGMSHLAQTVAGLGWKDGFTAVRDSYDVPTMGYFFFKALGVLMLLVIALTCLGVLAGVIIGVAALARSAPGRFHLWLVRWTFPRRTPGQLLGPILVGATVAAVLTSGVVGMGIDALNADVAVVPAETAPPPPVEPTAPPP